MRCSLPVLSITLQDYGWTLVWEKSHVWLPDFDGVEDLPTGGPSELCALVTRCVGGIPLLGAAADSLPTDTSIPRPPGSKSEAAFWRCRIGTPKN